MQPAGAAAAIFIFSCCHRTREKRKKETWAEGDAEWRRAHRPPPPPPMPHSRKTNRQIESKAETEPALLTGRVWQLGGGEGVGGEWGTRDEPSGERQADHEKQREEQRVTVSLQRERSCGGSPGKSAAASPS